MILIKKSKLKSIQFSQNESVFIRPNRKIQEAVKKFLGKTDIPLWLLTNNNHWGE